MSSSRPVTSMCGCGATKNFTNEEVNGIVPNPYDGRVKRGYICDRCQKKGVAEFDNPGAFRTQESMIRRSSVPGFIGGDAMPDLFREDDK